MRWVLTEAAQRAKTQPPFTRFYAECAHRRGKQTATVAVARKLLARSFHILNQVHATSAEGQPAGCARESADPAPVLAGVKVARPVGRSTLTPARPGKLGHHEKAAGA
ncbi:MAG TPA: hypothetical protein VFA46_24540 [Actinomycetes bacterium]|nr:hypothetical protein [Actinomycetes bacterium]